MEVLGLQGHRGFEKLDSNKKKRRPYLPLR